MKLLFDNNLSSRLPAKLADLFPNSQHVLSIQMDETEDADIWDYAIDNDFIIVSKDEDFNILSELHGSPPKLIWIRTGNCPTSLLENLLRQHYDDITDMVANQSIDKLELQ